MKGKLILLSELLVSVRNGCEAKLAIEAGADWVDAKEPLNGPMGRPGEEASNEIFNEAAPFAKTTCAMGEIIQWHKALGKPWPSFHYLKFGLSEWAIFPTEVKKNLEMAIQTFNGIVVPVLFADHIECRSKPLLEGVTKLQSMGVKAVVVDTWNKNEGWIGQKIELQVLHRVQELCFCNEIRFGIAGSLNAERIQWFMTKGIVPHWFGVRGGVCKKDVRAGQLSVEKIKHIKEKMALFQAGAIHAN